MRAVRQRTTDAASKSSRSEYRRPASICNSGVHESVRDEPTESSGITQTTHLIVNEQALGRGPKGTEFARWRERHHQPHSDVRSQLLSKRVHPDRRPAQLKAGREPSRTVNARIRSGWRSARVPGIDDELDAVHKQHDEPPRIETSTNDAHRVTSVRACGGTAR